MKQSKNPPNVLPQPCLLALLPSNASIKELKIIAIPKYKRKFSDNKSPSLPFGPILGGLEPVNRTQMVRNNMGNGPTKVRKFALSLQYMKYSKGL